VLFDKIVSEYILFERYLYVLALEMASPWNQHGANCIGTLSFPVDIVCVFVVKKERGKPRKLFTLCRTAELK